MFSGKTYIKVQHFRVKVTFYLLRVQYLQFHSFLCLSAVVKKNHYLVNNAVHLSYNQPQQGMESFLFDHWYYCQNCKHTISCYFMLTTSNRLNGPIIIEYS